MPEIGNRPLQDFDSGVDFFAAVARGDSRSRTARRSDTRLARRDDDVGHVDVIVLDDRTALRRSPDDVERAHRFAGEVALDPRTSECLGHDAVERAVPADRNRARPRRRTR